MKQYIEREAAKKVFCKLCYYQYTGKCKICPVDAIPTVDTMTYTPVRTKADCIRNMNINELANFLQGMCPPEFHPCPYDNQPVKNCFVCWLDYLSSME